jgi:hypothetical protein
VGAVVLVSFSVPVRANAASPRLVNSQLSCQQGVLLGAVSKGYCRDTEGVSIGVTAHAVEPKGL